MQKRGIQPRHTGAQNRTMQSDPETVRSINHSNQHQQLLQDDRMICACFIQCEIDVGTEWPIVDKCTQITGPVTHINQSNSQQPVANQSINQPK